MTDRKVYSEEFKREAVQLAHERGNFSAAARELGISDSVLFRWKKQLDAAPDRAFPGQGNPHDPEKVRLEREVTRLREEVEILKKLSVSLLLAPGEIPICSRVRGAMVSERLMSGNASLSERLLCVVQASLERR